MNTFEILPKSTFGRAHSTLRTFFLRNNDISSEFPRATKKNSFMLFAEKAFLLSCLLVLRFEINSRRYFCSSDMTSTITWNRRRCCTEPKHVFSDGGTAGFKIYGFRQHLKHGKMPRIEFPINFYSDSSRFAFPIRVCFGFWDAKLESIIIKRFRSLKIVKTTRRCKKYFKASFSEYLITLNSDFCKKKIFVRCIFQINPSFHLKCSFYVKKFHKEMKSAAGWKN